jgi:UDP-N-acetylglucosamine--N-acetylmuramyl-(pentapeptide) pyrophosphoryl-undecaprenol N-acetylglucosamine transferase
MFAGGGTGGHLYIGISLARELRKRNPELDFIFIGTRRGLESRIVPGEGFKLDYIDSGGLKGMDPVTLLSNILLIPRSILQSRGLLRRHLPAVVVGVGGYSSGPVVLAAWLQGIPTMIVEPNAYPGLTNRLLSRVVNRVALALPDEGKHFGKKGIVTGIPVRKEFYDMKPPARRPGHLTVLIFGGSQGSRALNSIVSNALGELKDLGDKLRLIHQTGEKEFESMRRAYRDSGMVADVRPYLPNIFEQFRQSDLVICRAGAGTVAEITTAGKAAILVPYPHAADDHQTKNARALESFGAARLIAEADLTPERLGREIRHFMQHHEEIECMEAAARKLAKSDAARQIAELIVDMSVKRQSSAAKSA